MMSYPNWFGPKRSLQHPDLRLLAEVSQEAGVDLKIIVLQRNAKDILESELLNRHWDKWVTGGMVELVRTLMDNTFVMVGQLRLIDRRFWRCVNLLDGGRVSVAFPSFVHDSFSKDNRWLWQTMIETVRAPGAPHLSNTSTLTSQFPGWIQQLSFATSLLADVCSSASSGDGCLD